jgi:hypothetical protein
MSIVKDKVDSSGRYIKDSATIMKADVKTAAPSFYNPSTLARQCINEFLIDFRNGWQTMHLTRPEFNDMSLYQRHVIDMLAFNTYQENDGNPMMEDRLGGWQSQAMRPIIRNSSIAMCAHQTARQLVPKVQAYNNQDEMQEDSAKVMSYLVDWAREQANYPHMALYRNIAALYSPISWGYSEYVTAYSNVKDGKNADGTWKYKKVINEDESGFKHTPLAADQIFFSDFYTRDTQKQDFIIWRQVMSYDRAKAKYGHYKNFEYVSGGIIVTMDDANSGFYQVYDPHMRQFDVEVVIRWRKSTDSRDIMINGVLMTEPWAANPRDDHQYPFDSFYYLPINERCIAGKSLVFSLQSDARLANEFYQMIADGTKLNLFPPTATIGSDKAGVDVIVPGLNLAFSDPEVKIQTIKTADGQSLQTTMQTLEKIEASIHESSQDPLQQGQQQGGTPSSAYEISRIEQNSTTVLGLSIKFFTFMHVIPYGRLLLADILQYMTVADAEKTIGDGGLMYKTFYANEPGKTGHKNKVMFSANMPDSMTEEEKGAISWALLKEQGGLKSSTTLWLVNPSLFREQKYIFTVDADVLNPRSAELERAFAIELFDRAIAHPETFKNTEIAKILLATDPTTARNPDKYIVPPPPPVAPQQQPGTPGQGANPQTGQPGVGSAPKPAPASQGNQLPQK